MLAPQLGDDLVLERVEILELVDEHAVPPCTHALHHVAMRPQLRRLQDERVEVGEVAITQESLVLLEVRAVVVMREGLVAEPVRREAPQDRALIVEDADAPQHGPLRLVVEDAEPALESDACAELAQE